MQQRINILAQAKRSTKPEEAYTHTESALHGKQLPSGGESSRCNKEQGARRTKAEGEAKIISRQLCRVWDTADKLKWNPGTQKKKKKNTGKNVWKTQHNKLPSDVGCVQDSQEWPEIYPKWALERIWSANRLHLQRSYISRGWEHWEPQRNRTPNVRPGSAANEVGPSPQAGRNELYNNDCDGGYKVDLRESAQWEKKPRNILRSLSSKVILILCKIYI